MDSKTSRSERIFVLIALFIVLSFTFFPTKGMAQSDIKLSETELVFRGLVGVTLQRTVTLEIQGDPIFGLQYVVSDLVDPDTKDAILSELITVTPPDLSQLSSNQVVTITITGTETYGTFHGNIKFFYPDQPEDQILTLNLTAELSAVPTVDADVNSKNLTLFVEPSALDFPFGRPEVSDTSPKLGEVVLSLVQVGDSPAIISNAKVLAMQSNNGRTLPEQAVRVDSQFPINLDGKDATTVRVQAQGRNLPAGEYSGTLLVNVENQPGPIQIPLKVQVKDGPILALILLAAGPLVGVLFFYWNRDGKTLLESQRRIQKLQSILQTGKYLTIQDQQQAKIKLDSIMDTIIGRGDLSTIDPLLIEVETFIQGQKAIGEQSLLTIQNQIQRLKNFSMGKTLRDQTIAELNELMNDLETGKIPTWDFMQKKMDAFQLQIDEMEQIIEELNQMDQERQTVLVPRLDQARSIDEFRNVIAEGRSIIPKKLVEILSGEPGARPDWQRFTIVLQWRRLAVAAIVYIFTLFVGWITLYASSPTFGANREDYITLFLWGVASNMVGGQAIDLKSILSGGGNSTSDLGQ